LAGTPKQASLKLKALAHEVLDLDSGVIFANEKTSSDATRRYWGQFFWEAPTAKGKAKIAIMQLAGIATGPGALIMNHVTGNSGYFFDVASETFMKGSYNRARKWNYPTQRTIMAQAVYLQHEELVVAEKR